MTAPKLQGDTFWRLAEHLGSSGLIILNHDTDFCRSNPQNCPFLNQSPSTEVKLRPCKAKICLREKVLYREYGDASLGLAKVCDHVPWWCHGHVPAKVIQPESKPSLIHMVFTSSHCPTQLVSSQTIKPSHMGRSNSLLHLIPSNYHGYGECRCRSDQAGWLSGNVRVVPKASVSCLVSGEQGSPCA